jgi:hypothetical protein
MPAEAGATCFAPKVLTVAIEDSKTGLERIPKAFIDTSTVRAICIQIESIKAAEPLIQLITKSGDLLLTRFTVQFLFEISATFCSNLPARYDPFQWSPG